MQTIAISGASGFVGNSLIKFFTSLNYKVTPVKREILDNKTKLEELLNSSDIVINLSGANIINRWSESYKKLLYSSRIETTQKIVSAINNISNPPKIIISTSAVGIYDNKKT